MSYLRKSILFISIFNLPIFLFSQDDFGDFGDEELTDQQNTSEVMTVTGHVYSTSGAALSGANVLIDGTDMGTATDENGEYSIEDVAVGSAITASVIGYENQTLYADQEIVDFSLTQVVIQLSALEVLASRAEDNTPVAYADVSKDDIKLRLGSQDVPMVLNMTPSVYATQQGGGAGDARINVRGFNQRNVAVMLNGVPVNDMENGWVYWSNWDGVSDAAQSVQLQRGLSAVNLATPSIGGSLNIITDPARQERGGLFKQEIGAGGFLKTTASYHSGLIAGDKLAVSGTIVRKTGDGLIDKTWTDAWAYYLGASYALNDDHRLEFYALGAPQRHGQNLYKQNAGAYSHEFAQELNENEYGYDLQATAEDGKFMDAGRKFNQNWSPVDPSYEGKQYWYMYGAKTVDRYDPNFINERENYFHKPQVNMNHYWNINADMNLSSTFYFSGGSGGGTGTYGRIPTLDADGTLGGEDYKFYYGRSPWTRDWNTLIAYNSGTDDTVYVDKRAIARDAAGGESVGILRNSINRQWTLGVISKLNYQVNSNLKAQVGIDWRTAEIEHAREVRDLMGGNYYMDYADDNAPDGKRVELGDIIAYHNHNTVDWLGAFAQGNYTKDAMSLYGMFGFSTIKYTHQNHFLVGDPLVEADPLSALQTKGGLMYDLGDAMSFFNVIPLFGKVYDQAKLYVNAGYVEKVPILDNVIDDSDGTLASDPLNEKFMSMEFGLNFSSSDGTMAAKLNLYNTDWKDRNVVKSVSTGEGSSGDTDLIFLTGVNQNHKGMELEGNYQLHDMFRLDVILSYGNWQFIGDATGNYKEFTEQGTVTTEYAYGLDGLKVGDQPQASVVVGGTVTPIDGLSIQALYSHYHFNYADWSPTSRTGDSDGEFDRSQVWRAPDYDRVDIHMFYNLPVEFNGITVQAFAHVFNALDAVFVQDAYDNSQYNAYTSNGKTHAGDDAEVFLGLPMSFNAGINFNFYIF